MVLQLIYDTFYALNPLKPRSINYEKEFEQDLPALPDLPKHFSRLTAYGTVKKAVDPRFPDNNCQFSKRCFTNFAVWRKCLEVHAENMDPKDPNAAICRKYKNLAFRSCMKLEVCFDCWVFEN